MSPVLSSASASRFLFFGGKGGVGKTTCAAAAAIALAGAGQVLALSLDPAHSLRDVLGLEEMPGLEVLELDARQQFGEFMDRHRGELGTIADRGTYLDQADIQAFLNLSLPGLDEVMGLLQLGRLAAGSTYARVVVDLPPTGHALRLFDISSAFDQVVRALDLMQDKHRFAVSSLTRRYASDEIDAFLARLQRQCDAAREVLFGAGQSAFLLVARPEPMILAETVRYAARLRAMGAPLAGLILNGAGDGPDLPPELQGLELVRVPVLADPPVGLEPLRTVAAALAAAPERHASSEPPTPDRLQRPATERPASERPAGGSIAALLAEPRRLLIFGGKGGVGKTTMAAASGVGLARRVPGRSVVVVSIDPAHSLMDSVGEAAGAYPNLKAVELEVGDHWGHWAGQGQELFQGLLGGTRWDPVYDREIAQQLARIQPAGLDELLAASSVIDLLEEDTARLVVVDSAPTGHLIRFLESPAVVIEWSRELMRILLKYDLASRLKELSEELLALSRKAKRLQALLRDDAACELVVVALAEPAVLAETERLLDRLRAMSVPVRHLVLNQLTAAGREAAQRLKERHPELEFVEIERRADPIQGRAALEELAA